MAAEWQVRSKDDIYLIHSEEQQEDRSIHDLTMEYPDFHNQQFWILTILKVNGLSTFNFNWFTVDFDD